MESWLPVQPGVWYDFSKCHPLPTLPIEGTFFINILMSEWKGAWFYEGWLRHWGLIVLIQIGSAAGTSRRLNRLWVGEGRTACWWLHTVTEHLLSYSFAWKIDLLQISNVSLNMHDESSPPAPLYLIVCLNKIPLFLRKKKIEIERSWWGQGL